MAWGRNQSPSTSRMQGNSFRDLVDRFNQPEDQRVPSPSQGLRSQSISLSPALPKSSYRRHHESQDRSLSAGQVSAQHVPEQATSTAWRDIRGLHGRDGYTPFNMQHVQRKRSEPLMTDRHLSASQKVASNSSLSRSTLFGEVVSESNGGFLFGYGIPGTRQRRTSEGNMRFKDPDSGRYRSFSDLDYSLHPPKSWYQGLSPPRTRVTHENDRLEHKRSRSDFAGSPPSAQEGRAKLDPIAVADQNGDYYSHNGQDLQATQSSTSPRSRLPVSTRRPIGSAQNNLSNFPSTVSPPLGESAISTATPSAFPPPIKSSRVHKVTLPSRTYVPDHNKNQATNQKLKAVVAASPPKKSPPLRSSRPRAPLSSTSTAAPKAKFFERSPTSPSIRAKLAAKDSIIKPRKIPNLGPTDFAARREQIQRAISQSISTNEEPVQKRVFSEKLRAAKDRSFIVEQNKENIGVRVAQQHGVADTNPTSTQSSADNQGSRRLSADGARLPGRPEGAAQINSQPQPISANDYDLSHTQPSKSLPVYSSPSTIDSEAEATSNQFDTGTMRIHSHDPAENHSDGYSLVHPNATNAFAGYAEFTKGYSGEYAVLTSHAGTPNSRPPSHREGASRSVVSENGMHIIKGGQVQTYPASTTQSYPDRDTPRVISERDLKEEATPPQSVKTGSPETSNPEGLSSRRSRSVRGSDTRNLVLDFIKSRRRHTKELSPDASQGVQRRISGFSPAISDDNELSPEKLQELILERLRMTTTVPEKVSAQDGLLFYPEADTFNLSPDRLSRFSVGNAEDGQLTVSSRSTLFEGSQRDSLKPDGWSESGLSDRASGHYIAFPPRTTLETFRPQDDWLDISVLGNSSNSEDEDTRPAPPPKDERRPLSPTTQWNRSADHTPAASDCGRSHAFRFSSDDRPQLPEIQSTGEGLGLSLQTSSSDDSPTMPLGMSLQQDQSSVAPPSGQSISVAPLVERHPSSPGHYSEQASAAQPKNESDHSITLQPPTHGTQPDLKGVSVEAQSVAHHDITSRSTANADGLVPMNEPDERAASISESVSGRQSEERRLMKRKHIIKELIDTEYTYSQDMKVIEDIYKGTTNSVKDLTADDVRVLFGNSEQVLKFSERFLDALKSGSASVYQLPRSQRWRAKQGSTETAGSGINDKASVHTSTSDMTDEEKDRDTFLGRAFQEHLPHMERVYRDYLKNHGNANKRLDQVQTNPTVAIWLRECQASIGDITSAWDLDSLLVKPVQRIAKYPMLLQELIASTPSEHPDRLALDSALKEVLDVLRRINEKNKRADLIDLALTAKPNQSDVRGL